MIEAPEIHLGFGSKMLILLVVVFGGAAIVYFKKLISWIQGLDDEG